MVARKRWVLVQAKPPSLCQYPDDIFDIVLQSLRTADTEIILEVAKSMSHRMKKIVGEEEIFPNEPLFAVVDEVQVAAECLSKSFRSFTTGVDKRSFLQAF